MIKFTKMEGLGNDYIYIYCEDNISNISDLSIKMSNRHFGVGGDGIILIMSSDIADFKMDIYNSDGSRAEMCGNGIRCVGKYVYDFGFTDKTDLKIETLSGVKNLFLDVNNGIVRSVKVDMGIPSFLPEDIHLKSFNVRNKYEDFSFVKINSKLINKDYTFTCVSMGNPHAVCFVNDLKFDIEKYGPLVENDERFLDRTNTEFIQIINRNLIKMRVWERGAGETLACGTGACAAVCAGIVNGFLDRKVEVQLLGGSLFIEWDFDNHIYMTGPASVVFNGEYEEN